MKIGCAKIVIVMMSVAVTVMIVVIMRRSRKNPGTEAVYDQTDNSHHQRLVVRDLHRVYETGRTLGDHNQSETEKQNRARKPREAVELPCAEREAFVGCEPACDDISKKRDAERRCMRGHVQAVGE